MEEIYFVVSSSDEPEQIYFSKDTAFTSEANYVDSFGKDGLKIKAYKLVDGKYTEDF